ncbi:MAG: hypothetical protein ACTS6J_26315 [Burkholderiales bacterium]
MATTAATFPIAEALFSKTRRPVFALLFGQPDKAFYTRESTRGQPIFLLQA